MKTGESVTDSQGTTWTVGQELGRGSHARAFVARAGSGREAVLKVALSAADLGAGASETLVRACGAILDEQATWMRERRRAWLPELIDVFTTTDGRRALLTPRHPATLASRMEVGATLSGLLQILLTATDHAAGGVHGNLRPENVLLTEDGRVLLSDPVTPGLESFGAALLERSPQRTRFRPPEAAGAPSSGWDTYAVCLAIFQAASLGAAAADGRRDTPPALPAEGLDKIALAAVKDRVLARLDQERANVRFAPRVAERLGTLLNRGLSRQATPSPPYRFGSAAELRTRLAEVRDLIDPRVEAVGKVLLAATARDGVFEDGALATFSTTVTCTQGVAHDDLATGLLVRDLDAEDDDRVPVPDARFTVKPHPTGRLRFEFELPELRPGRYTVRTAFTVKDSGHDPVTSDGHFEVRPPPGYVPPPEDTAPSTAPLRFPGAPPTGPRPLGDIPILDGPSLSADPFPTPIAPSDPGVLEDLDDGPVPMLRPLPTAPPTGPGPSTAGQPTHPPGLSPLPSIAPSTPPPPSPVEPEVTARAPSPAPSWNNPGTWESLPGVDSAGPMGNDHAPLLPTPEGMEDLPGFDGGSNSPSGMAWLEPVMALIQENTLVAMGGLIGALVAILVLAGLLFQSCAG